MSGSALRNSVSTAGLVILLTLILGTSSASGQGTTSAPAGLVLRGGKVITVDAEGTIAEAVAVSGNRIVAVGSEANSFRMLSPRLMK